MASSTLSFLGVSGAEVELELAAPAFAGVVDVTEVSVTTSVEIATPPVVPTVVVRATAGVGIVTVPAAADTVLVSGWKVVVTIVSGATANTVGL